MPGGVGFPPMIKAIFTVSIVVALATIVGLWMLVFLAWMYHCWVHRGQR